MKATIVNRLTKAGCKFIFWVADWFALLNNKMDGDLKKIQTVGRYMIEVHHRLLLLIVLPFRLSLSLSLLKM
jgi:tyrosyl-tRNA synthetase